MTFNWKYCLFALALLLSCSDNPRLDYPSEESLFPNVSGSAGSSSSVGESSSSPIAESSSSNLETEDSSSSSAESSSSVEESSSSPIAESSSSSPETAGSSSSEMSSSSVEQSSSSENLCSGQIPDSKFCFEGSIEWKCGRIPTGDEYNTRTEDCCGSKKFNKSSEFCVDDEIKDKCGGINTYTPATHFCLDGTVTLKCNGESYEATQFCFIENFVETIVDKCGSSPNGDKYKPTEEGCCGNKKYNTTTHFCYDNSKKIDNYCGINPQKYDPDLYECKPTINSNGIYLREKLTDTRNNKIYNAVLIGNQVWMAENLDHTCTNNCTSCGKTYTWATAKSVCPSNWHLPNKNEWEVLMTSVGGLSTAGTKLMSGGTNDYGFSGLLCGGTRTDGISWNVNTSGELWSASDNNANVAYENHIRINNSNAIWTSNASVAYELAFSVRCLKD